MTDGAPARNWQIVFGPYRVTKVRRSLERDGEPVHIGSRAFDILAYLLEHAGHVIGHRALLEAAWPGANVEEGNLRFQVTALRKLLGDQGRHIVNVPGRGYCFTAQVVRQDDDEPSSRSRGIVLNRVRSLPPVIPLVGRTEVVADVADLVRSHRLVSVVAPGGMGKTSVAVAAASNVAEVFGDGLCYVELGAVEDPKRIADALAVALGLAVQDADTLDDIVESLHARRMLILFDGCEHVIDAAATLLERVIGSTSHIHVLVTSREALRIEHELVFGLKPLACPPPGGEVTASDLLAYPATRLFMERAGIARVVSSLDDDDVRAILEICSKLDGLALAIELAAAHVHTFGLDKLADLLDERLLLEWPGRRTAPPRHQTLGAMLDWSYRLLTVQEQRVFRSLSVFAGSFDLAAASAVGDEGDAGTPLVIGDLVSKSLVCVLRTESETRYHLLDTTRTYARTELSQSGELDAVRRRHASYHLRALKDRNAGEPASSALKARANIEDLRAAIDWAFKSDPALAVRLVLGAIPLWESVSHFQEARVWTARALATLGNLREASQLEADLQLGLARATLFTSRFGEEFKDVWARVLHLAESLRQTDLQLAALVCLWGGEIMQANIPASLEYAKIFRRGINSDESFWTGFADWIEGVSVFHSGDYASAGIQLRRAAAENRPRALAEQRRLLAFDCRWLALMHVGLNSLMEGDAAQAADLTDKAVAGAYAVGLDFPCEMAEQVGAMVFNLIGDRERVRVLASSLLRRAEERSIPHFYHIARAHLSAVDAWHGNEKALLRLNDDIHELQRGGYGIFVRYFSAERLRISIERKRDGLRATALTPLSTTPARVGAWYLPEVVRLNGRLAALQNRPDDAEGLFREALERAKAQGSPFWALRIANDLAEIWIAAGKTAEARSLLEGALRAQVSGLATEDMKNAQSLLNAMAANDVLSDRA